MRVIDWNKKREEEETENKENEAEDGRDGSDRRSEKSVHECRHQHNDDCASKNVVRPRVGHATEQEVPYSSTHCQHGRTEHVRFGSAPGSGWHGPNVAGMRTMWKE